MVHIKFGLTLQSNFIEVSTFSYQSRDHLKNVDYSPSCLIFAEFDPSTIKRPYKKNYFISMVQTKYGQEL